MITDVIVTLTFPLTHPAARRRLVPVGLVFAGGYCATAVSVAERRVAD